MAESSDGASSGVKAMMRNIPLAGMQLRVIAYAKRNAAGTTTTVTAPATQRLFQSDCMSDGACR